MNKTHQYTHSLLPRLLAPKLLLATLLALGLSACSGSQPKEEVVVAEQTKAEDEVLAERMGMSLETVRAFRQAIAELKKPAPDQALVEKLLLQVVQAEPDFAAAHYNLGVLYSNQNRYEEAVKHIEKARDIAPGDLSHTVALAQAYAVTEQYAKAQNLLQEVIARQPTNLTAKNNLAVLAIKANDDEKAMEYVRDVLREDNQNVGALNSLGLIYAKQNNASLAKYVFTKAIKLAEKKPDPDIHNNLGLVYIREDDVPAAVQQFEAANKVSPNYLESRLNLGAILIEYLDYARAAEQFSQAVKIAPNNCTAHLGLAASSFGMGRQKGEQAASEFKFFLEHCDAKHVSSHERLAKLYETTLNDPRQAADYYDKLVTLVSDEKARANYKAMAAFLRSQADSASQKAPEEPAQDDAPAQDEADEEGGGDA